MEMDEEGDEIFEVSLEDPENNHIYKVMVSLEDFQRFQTDEQFASSLHFHAKCTAATASRTSNEIHSKSLCKAEDDNESNNNTRLITIWSYDQTRDLMNSMENHFEDFNHPRKRKHVYENVANDLCSMAYNITPTGVQNKWKSLLRSYKKAKDTKTRTGQGPSRFHFFDKMDEIVGNKPTNQCDHSLNTIETVDESSSSTSNVEKYNENTDRGDHADRDPDTPDRTNTNVRETKKQRFSQIKLQKDYIEMKKMEYKNRQTRHAERLGVENKKMEIEEKKLKILEQYLKNKK